MRLAIFAWHILRPDCSAEPIQVRKDRCFVDAAFDEFPLDGPHSKATDCKLSQQWGPGIFKAFQTSEVASVNGEARALRTYAPSNVVGNTAMGFLGMAFVVNLVGSHFLTLCLSLFDTPWALGGITSYRSIARSLRL